MSAYSKLFGFDRVKLSTIFTPEFRFLSRKLASRALIAGVSFCSFVSLCEANQPIPRCLFLAESYEEIANRVGFRERVSTLAPVKRHAENQQISNLRWPEEEPFIDRDYEAYYFGALRPLELAIGNIDAAKFILDRELELKVAKFRRQNVPHSLLSFVDGQHEIFRDERFRGLAEMKLRIEEMETDASKLDPKRVAFFRAGYLLKYNILFSQLNSIAGNIDAAKLGLDRKLEAEVEMIRAKKNAEKAAYRWTRF